VCTKDGDCHFTETILETISSDEILSTGASVTEWHSVMGRVAHHYLVSLGLIPLDTTLNKGSSDKFLE
jgi:hypothetical protein